MTPTQALDALGISMSVEFVPWSRSRFQNEENRSFNFMVTLKHGERVITRTDYMMGVGHSPGIKKFPKSYNQKLLSTHATKQEIIERETETGNEQRVTWGGAVSKAQNRNPIEPDIADVVYCLLSDSDVLNYSSFSEWANNLGYDDDSIKAEIIYRACLESALSFKNGLDCVMNGWLHDQDKDALEVLHAAFEDY